MTMGNIHQLDEKLSNMIAAGEVVENMASVVKELIENAIDANADKIAIDLSESGLRTIRIEDNGEGMDETDLKMAFKRHATSKIKTSHDLHHIASLGFRGEALPSIASVSNMTTESSTSDAIGTKITLKNGEIVSQSKGRAKRGTTVMVKNLFYNTPARLKHLKSAEKELSLIIEVCNRMALSHPNIAFSLSNDQKTLLKTTGDGDILKVLHQMYPMSVIKNMLYFEGSNAYFKISGYLSKPEITRSSSTHMRFFTNRRYIKNQRLNKSALKGMDTYLPLHKYPILYAHITVDPLLIDVNIHPQKLEIKFSEQRLLENLIETTLREKLQTTDLIPDIKKFEKPRQNNLKFDFDETRSSEQLSEQRIQDPAYQPPPKPPFKSRLPYMEYIGQAMGTYLIFQGEDTLFLIDQHAAEERIRYEQYRAQMEKESAQTQALISPFTLALSNAEMNDFKSYQPLLNALGVACEKNDDHSLKITEIPTWFHSGYEEIYTESLIRHILDEQATSKGQILDPLAKELACKHSIKGNQYINLSEVNRLWHDLAQCQNPYTCPHGRPTIIKFSQQELETLFKRIQS